MRCDVMHKLERRQSARSCSLTRRGAVQRQAGGVHWLNIVRCYGACEGRQGWVPVRGGGGRARGPGWDCARALVLAAALLLHCMHLLSA